VTDDQIGPPPGDQRFLPEFPVAGAPIIPPQITPPPTGTPPPGSLGARGADGWPWYFAFIALVGGFVVSQIFIIVLGAIWIAISGGKFETLNDDSTFILIASGFNEVIFIAAAVIVARMSGAVSFRDFGLVRAPFWKTLLRMAAVLGGYFVLLAIYNQLVHLAPDDAPDKLGAASGTTHMLAFAILVAILAPIAEEIFFRGMIFRALKNGIGMWAAAIVSGIIFGSLHIDSFSNERLLQVVPLVVLGVAFAVLYAWTGTLYSTIALHATNNAIAVAAYADKHHSDFGIALAGAIWVLMMLGCGFGYLFTDRGGEPPASGDIPGSGSGPVDYAFPR
jgi:membrane protease YdiL (CAAX protease family)